MREFHLNRRAHQRTKLLTSGANAQVSHRLYSLLIKNLLKMSRWPREPCDSLRYILWDCSKATCTYWLIDVTDRHVRASYRREEIFMKHTKTYSKLIYLSVSQVLFGETTWGSFNKNTSQFTLIIHHRTTARAMRGAPALMKVQSVAPLSFSITCLSVHPNTDLSHPWFQCFQWCSQK